MDERILICFVLGCCAPPHEDIRTLNLMGMRSLPLAYHGWQASHIVHTTDVLFRVFWYASPQNVKGDWHHERTDIFPRTAA
jgi:hypothetical protein